MIHGELCKKLKFDHFTKWYRYRPESVLENEMNKIFWDFELQTNHLILAKRSDLMTINKKKRTCRIVNFAVPADHGVKVKQSEKRKKYLDLARELRKLWNMNLTVIPMVIGALGTVRKSLETRE